MSATAAQAPVRWSGWRPVGRSAVVMLRRVAPWVLVVLVVTSLLFNGLAAAAAWRGVPPGETLIVQGDQGTAAITSGFVDLVALLGWMRTVRTSVPVLVAGGVTRCAVTGGLLVAVLALAVMATALLTLVAVTGAVLQGWVTTIAPGRFELATDASVYASALSLTVNAPEGYFNPERAFAWFVIAGLTGALLGAARYRRRARRVLGVLLGALATWAVYVTVVLHVPFGLAVFLTARSSPLAPLFAVGLCLILAAAVWLVLRRIPLRPPAR